MMVPLDWTPVKQAGGVFCSPACGCDCKLTDYKRALRGAQRLAARLVRTVGGTWRPEVVESHGRWGYRASKGSCEVLSVGDSKKYWVSLISDTIQFHHEDLSPEKAINVVWLRLKARALKHEQDASMLAPQRPRARPVRVRK